MHKCFDGSCKNCAKWDVGTHAHLWSSIPPVRPSFKIWSTYTKFDQEAVVLPFLFFYQFAALKCSSCLQTITTDRNRRSPQSRCQISSNVKWSENSGDQSVVIPQTTGLAAALRTSRVLHFLLWLPFFGCLNKEIFRCHLLTIINTIIVTNPIRIARFSDDIFALEGVGSRTVR